MRAYAQKLHHYVRNSITIIPPQLSRRAHRRDDIIMAILTVYTKLLDKTLEGARIIDMGSTKTCQCYVLPYDKVAKVGKE